MYYLIITALAAGAIGILSLVFSAWIMPAAVASVLFYGRDEIKHIANTGKNRIEMFATVSDLWVALVLAVYIIGIAVAAR